MPREHIKDFSRRLTPCLKDSLPALALVDGIAHWVVVGGKERNRFWIFDSCRTKPYSLTVGRFRKRFTAGILITDFGCPHDFGARDYAASYLRGTRLCLGIAGMPT